MTPARSVLLDSEAVQALLWPRHRKHRHALAVVEAALARNDRRAGAVSLVVPTAVRVEAGWDRRAPTAAAINHLRVDDVPLDSRAADRAVGVRAGLGVSVADAHLGVAMGAVGGPHVVVTGDAPDVHRMAERLGTSTTVVTL